MATKERAAVELPLSARSPAERVVADLRAKYDIGRQILDGRRSIQELAREYEKAGNGKAGADLLYKAQRFARRYTPEQRDELFQLCQDGSLRWSHVIHLLTFNPAVAADLVLRERLQKRAAREKWSAESLAQAVQIKRPNNRQRRTGKRTRFAASFASLAAEFEDWHRRLVASRPCNSDENGEHQDLLDPLRKLPNARLAAQKVEIRRSIAAATALRNAIDERILVLKGLLRRADRSPG